MRKIWTKYFGTAALAFMLCLTGLVMSGEAQAQRLVDNGNGTVTDTVTSLMWTKNANLFGKRNWDEAMAIYSSIGIYGFSGWRLPSWGELVALYHAMQGGHPFTGIMYTNYWSSTTNGLFYAWNVSMRDGSVVSHYKEYKSFIWLVRDSQ